MRKYSLHSVGLLLFVLVFMAPTRESQACDEPDMDLKLGTIKTIQVAGTSIFPSEAYFSPSAFEAPFKASLNRKGVKINQNDYDHVLAWTVEIETKIIAGQRVFAVYVSARYDEPCLIKRLKEDTTCTLWQQLELLHIFDDPSDLNKWLVQVATQWSKEFAEQFSQD